MFSTHEVFTHLTALIPYLLSSKIIIKTDNCRLRIHISRRINNMTEMGMISLLFLSVAFGHVVNATTAPVEVAPAKGLAPGYGKQRII